MSNVAQLFPTQPQQSMDDWDDAQWGEYINAIDADPVGSIIEKGRRLKLRHSRYPDTAGRPAKGNLPWAAFCKQYVRMSKRTANRYIAIAEWAEIETHGSQLAYLPASWRTIYEITRLTEEQFQHGIDTGIINPEMERSDL